MKALAVGCWVAAWFCAGLIPSAWFTARDGERALARFELAAGVIGAASLAWAGAVLW